MNKKSIWLITAKTNLHVGNENTSNYGLIDLAVQRNATTGLPCINSSSLKGALNEFAANRPELDPEDLIRIFGCDKKKRKDKTEKGKYTFFDANILFLPVQDDEHLFQLVTCDAVLNRFTSQVELLTNGTVKIDKDQLKKDFGCSKVISDKEFNERCKDDNLPIIARNVLDNGESKNLWYEQVVPAETVFYTIIDSGNDEKLAKLLSAEKTIVQIGANASIGYGYCKFTNLK